MEICLLRKSCSRVVFPADEGPMIAQCSFVAEKEGIERSKEGKRTGLCVDFEALGWLR